MKIESKGMIEWLLGLFWGWRLNYLMERGISSLNIWLFLPSSILLLLLLINITTTIKDRKRLRREYLSSAVKIILISITEYFLIQIFNSIYT